MFMESTGNTGNKNVPTTNFVLLHLRSALMIIHSDADRRGKEF